jgi:hypothetical protein
MVRPARIGRHRSDRGVAGLWLIERTAFIGASGDRISRAPAVLTRLVVLNRYPISLDRVRTKSMMLTKRSGMAQQKGGSECDGESR